MKKRLFSGLLALMLLGGSAYTLASCKKDSTSTSTSTSTPDGSSSSSSTDGGSSTSPTTPEEYKIPETAKEQWEAIVNAADETTAGFRAKLVGIQKYTSNKDTFNGYFQNGDYGFRVNNLKLDLNMEVGKDYEIIGTTYAANKKKAYCSLKSFSSVTEYATAITADAKQWSSDIDFATYCSGLVEGTGTVVEQKGEKITVKVGESNLVLSYQNSVEGGPEIGEKLGLLMPGMTIAFRGYLYTGNTITDISLLYAKDVTVTPVEMNGTINLIESSDTVLPNNKLTGTVEGTKLTVDGTVGWSMKDADHRYEAGNIVGIKLTQNATLPDLKNVSVIQTIDETSTTFTNADLVSKNWLVADGIEMFVPVTSDLVGKSVTYTVKWYGTSVVDQTFEVAYASTLQITAEPSDRYFATDIAANALIKGEADPVDTVLASTYTHNDGVGGTLVIGAGETDPKEIAYTADKGNAVTLTFTAPTEAVEGEIVLSLSKNGEGLETLTPVTLTDGKFTKELVFTAASDTFAFTLRYKGNTLAQDVTVTLSDKVTLQKDPNAPEETTVVADVQQIGAANSWASGTQHPTLLQDDTLTISTTHGSNSGKFYTSSTPHDWRIYASERSVVTIALSEAKIAEGYKILTVKVDYTQNKNGVFKQGETTIMPGDTAQVNDVKLELAASVGQCRVTAFTIVLGK